MVSLQVDSRQNADTLFFTDCKRRVDFVLVYQTGSRSIDQRRAMRRANLEDFLKKEGLQFEIDVKPVRKVFIITFELVWSSGISQMPAHLIPSLDSINHKLRGRSRKPSGDAVDVAATMCFMKIHATWDMLTKYADFMKMKMPLIVSGFKGRSVRHWNEWIYLNKEVTIVTARRTGSFILGRSRQIWSIGAVLFVGSVSIVVWERTVRWIPPRKCSRPGVYLRSLSRSC